MAIYLLVVYLCLTVVWLLLRFTKGWVVFVREHYLQCLFWFLVVCFTCPGFVSCRMDHVQDTPGQQEQQRSVSDVHSD